MASILGGAICNAIIQSLPPLAGQANPLTKRTKTGLINALTSPMNTQGQTAVKVDQGNGLRRSVTIQYPQRMVRADVLSAIPADCATVNEWVLQETDFDAALFSIVNQKIDENYVKRICFENGQGSVTRSLIAGMFNAMAEDINAKLIAAAVTKFGNNVENGTGAQITLDIYETSDGSVKMQTINDFGDQLVNKNQTSGKPLIVSGSTMWKVGQSMGVSCCNDAGIDIAQVAAGSPWLFFNDQQIDGLLGAGESIVIEQGAAQLVTYYKYRNLGPVLQANGALAAFEQADGSMRGIITDPQPGGLTYNIRIFPDVCEEEFIIEMSLAYDIFTLPTDMYKNGDPLDGVNGLFDYKFTGS